MVSARFALLVYLLAAGCRQPAETAGFLLHPQRVYRAGETVKFRLTTTAPAGSREIVIADAIGNVRCRLEATALQAPAEPAPARQYRGHFQMLEPLTRRHFIRAGAHEAAFDMQPAYPARYPLAVAGNAGTAAAWLSSGLLTATDAGATPRAALFERLCQAQPIALDAADARTFRSVAGFLAPLRGLAGPAESTDAAVFDATGRVTAAVPMRYLRLDTARIFMLEIPDVLNAPVQLRAGRGGRWYEPVRGVALGSGRGAAVSHRPARLTAVCMLPYEVRRLEMQIEREEPAGFLVRAELLSPSPITSRHPLLIEALDDAGAPVRCGVRVVVAARGVVRWWFIVGPDTKGSVALLRLTDLLTGAVAERVLSEAGSVPPLH